MSSIQELVQNNKRLPYPELCQAILDKFGGEKKINWESVLPAQQQKDLFGGETLRIISDHPTLSSQKDIRPIVHLAGQTSQLLFFYVQLKEEKLPKTDIERLTRKFIGGNSAERYIIWFFGNKHQNTLKVVISGKDGKKIVLKTLSLEAGEWYKTYDFILNKVAEQFNTGGLFQREKEPALLWKALWEAFDISIVNKKFYYEIKQAFDSLIKDNLSKTKGILTTDEARSQFAIRLIGRIIFCWFLKKKGIIKDNVLSSQAVRDNKFYYHSLLEILFFEIFNKPLAQRRKNLPAQIAEYPFLNGGLFDPQETDHKDNIQLVIEDEWFETFFSQTLERYNFTVDENSSSSSEIAIDPEMLGRIFENLLAEQNPETGESARKATGSFYTPREIVEYMVEESLIAYLTTKLGADGDATEPIVPDEQLTLVPIKKQPAVQLGFAVKNAPKLEDIADFVHTQDLTDALQPYTKEIEKALNEITVLDPACGSGAFPMGALQKIVGLKHALNDKKDLYDVKLHTIQNSIYGVDIQPMATELSRLRCWLSLIVDEDPKDIKPLPNLDFKFVTANSLIDLGYDKFISHREELQRKAGGSGGGKIAKLETLAEFTSEIERYKKEYFQAGNKKDAKEKDRIKKEFDRIQNKILQHTLLMRNNHPELTIFFDNLVKWQPFDETKVSPFFSISWMFGVNDGFDVVIGNPPYGFRDVLTPDEKKYFRKIEKIEFKSGDSAELFIIKGFDAFLKNKGVLTLIVPKKSLYGDSWENVRKKYWKQFNLIFLLDTSKSFENVLLEANAFCLRKAPLQNKITISILDKNDSIQVLDSIKPTQLFSTKDTAQPYQSLFSKDLVKKIRDNTYPQLLVKGDLGLGIGTDFFSEKETEYKLLKGIDIERWNVRSNRWFKNIKNLNWENAERFLKPKILCQRLVAHIDNPYPHLKITACYDDEGIIITNTLIAFELDKKILSNFWLGYLNSKFVSWYSYNFIFARAVRTMDFYNFYNEQIPIPKNCIEHIELQKPIVSKVEKIIKAKKSNNESVIAQLENEIDILVYKLYNFTYSEVKTIDPLFGLSEEEYENVKL